MNSVCCCFKKPQHELNFHYIVANGSKYLTLLKQAVLKQVCYTPSSTIFLFLEFPKFTLRGPKLNISIHPFS